jgi:hypothetical protein
MSSNRRYDLFPRIARSSLLSFVALVSGLLTFGLGRSTPHPSQERFISLVFIGSAAADTTTQGCQPPATGTLPTNSATQGFLRWLDAGGEQRVGLPVGSMSQLREATTLFVKKGSSVCLGLERLRREWLGLTSVSTADAAEGAATRMIGELGGMIATNREAVAASTSSKSRVSEAIGIVEQHVDADKREIGIIQGQIDAKRPELEQAGRDLREAQNRVNNPTWTDTWAQGLSRGGYDPKKENLLRAQRAAAELNGQLEALRARQADLDARSSELAGKLGLLKTLESLGATLTEFQNAATTAQGSLSSAHRNYTKAADAQAEGAARYYVRHAGSDMKILIDWIDTFKSAVGRLA